MLGLSEWMKMVNLQGQDNSINYYRSIQFLYKSLDDIWDS